MGKKDAKNVWSLSVKLFFKFYNMLELGPCSLTFGNAIVFLDVFCGTWVVISNEIVIRNFNKKKNGMEFDNSGKFGKAHPILYSHLTTRRPTRDKGLTPITLWKTLLSLVTMKFFFLLICFLWAAMDWPICFGNDCEKSIFGTIFVSFPLEFSTIGDKLLNHQLLSCFQSSNLPHFFFKCWTRFLNCGLNIWCIVENCNSTSAWKCHVSHFLGESSFSSQKKTFANSFNDANESLNCFAPTEIRVCANLLTSWKSRCLTNSLSCLKWVYWFFNYSSNYLYIDQGAIINEWTIVHSHKVK